MKLVSAYLPTDTLLLHNLLSFSSLYAFIYLIFLNLSERCHCISWYMYNQGQCGFAVVSSSLCYTYCHFRNLHSCTERGILSRIHFLVLPCSLVFAVVLLLARFFFLLGLFSLWHFVPSWERGFNGCSTIAMGQFCPCLTKGSDTRGLCSPLLATGMILFSWPSGLEQSEVILLPAEALFSPIASLPAVSLWVQEVA